MSIHGYLLDEATGACPYIAGNSATHEQLIVERLSETDLEGLLAAGYRHFGGYFFRPVCSKCHQCVPLRVPLARYRFSRSARRLFNRNYHLLATLERPCPTHAAYELYLFHKKRFDEPPGGGRDESYDEFVATFFHPFPFAYQLSIYDRERLIAVSHLDITSSVISLVYCYYDDSYRKESLGSFAIYKELEIGLKRKLDFLYLGYYVCPNEHMNYKVRFRPNQVLREEGRWEDLLDMGGNLHDNMNELGEVEFVPKHRLQGGH